MLFFKVLFIVPYKVYNEGAISRRRALNREERLFRITVPIWGTKLRKRAVVNYTIPKLSLSIKYMKYYDYVIFTVPNGM